MPQRTSQVTGRNVEIPDHYRVYGAEELARAERIDHSIQRFDVELTHENNRRQRRTAGTSRITYTAGGDRWCAARDVRTLSTAPSGGRRSQTREPAAPGQDRRKVHYGDKTPVSSTGHGRAARSGSRLRPRHHALAGRPGRSRAVEVEEHEPGHIVRVKEHPAADDRRRCALRDGTCGLRLLLCSTTSESDRPTVVYRRHAYDYGLIRLADQTGLIGAYPRVT